MFRRASHVQAGARLCHLRQGWNFKGLPDIPVTTSRVAPAEARDDQPTPGH